MVAFCQKYAEKLHSHVRDYTNIIQSALEENKNILFEGAQGTMLDIDHGTYPFVTSSNPISAGASTGSGIGFTNIQKVLGVFKAYVTRVGEGPFLTELNDAEGQKLQKIGKEFGTTTGRQRRCGWFDAVITRYSKLVNGLTGIALTKIDVFDNFDEIKICIAYKDSRTGKIYENYPPSMYIQNHLEPIYEIMPGWKQDISGIRSFNELPENAQRFIHRIEELTCSQIQIISVGPGRDQTIIRNFPLT